MKKDKEEIDLYATLGISEDATAEDIKKAYKKRAKETHPDKKGGSEEEFKAVNEAHEVLGDEQRRAVYDQTGETEKVDNQQKIVDFLMGSILPTVLEARDVTKINIVDRIKEYIQENFESVAEEEIETNRKIKRIEEVKKRLRVKEGENIEDVFGDVLTGKQEELERSLIMLEVEREFLREAGEFIDKYEYIIDNLISINSFTKDNDNSADKKLHIDNKFTKRTKA